MQTPVHHTINNNSFWLSPQRCIFWQEENAIIASDLHLGKTGHFRKSGIAVPQTVFKEDLQRLIDLVQSYKAEKLIIAGDLFHSKENKELNLFKKWRHDFPLLEIHLIKGNHDILKDEWYGACGITVHKKSYSISGFCFVHDAADADCDAGTEYYFTGHIHPGIYINGMARQGLSLPCFYFTPKFAVLPAFSRFTGLFNIKKSAADAVFAIAEKSVIKI